MAILRCKKVDFGQFFRQMCKMTPLQLGTKVKDLFKFDSLKIVSFHTGFGKVKFCAIAKLNSAKFKNLPLTTKINSAKFFHF